MIGLNKGLSDGACKGIFIKIPSVEIVELVAYSGYDYIVIDCEHAPLTMKDVNSMVIAAQGLGLKAIVRVCDFNKTNIQQALDIGADGVQVPQIYTVADAKEVVRLSRYVPMGQRGAVLSSRSSQYGNCNKEEYFKNANDNVSLVVHIETEEALRNVDEIAKVEGIDVLFLGPFDLSTSLQTDGNFVSGGLKAPFERIRDAVFKNGKEMGILVSSDEELEYALKNGVKYIIRGTDLGLLKVQLVNNSKAMDTIFEKVKCAI